MTEAEALSQAADRYRNEGFTVTVDPSPDQLPEALRRGSRSLVARQNGTSVLVEVWTRGRINDLPPAVLPPGWEFDVIVLPRPEGVPDPGPPATPEFTRRLLSELENMVPKGARGARFLLGWSAVEAAMRVAAQRVGIDPQALVPRQLMSELVSAGVLSHDRFGWLQERFVTRNRLVHGVPVDITDSRDVDEMVVLARELLGEPLAAAS